MSGFFSKKQLRELVLLSATQIARLERRKKFPRRVRLGLLRNSRVGWPKDEVNAWVQAKIDARSSE